MLFHSKSYVRLPEGRSYPKNPMKYPMKYHFSDHSIPQKCPWNPTLCSSHLMSSPDFHKSWLIICGENPPNSDSHGYWNGTPPIKQPFGVYESRVEINPFYVREICPSQSLATPNRPSVHLLLRLGELLVQAEGQTSRSALKAAASRQWWRL